MVYRYGEKLKRSRRNVKKYVLGAFAAVLMTGGFALPALASTSGDGSDYGTQPGYTQATTQTDCAGAGAFDAFGQGFNFGNSTSGHTPYAGNAQNGNGADGQATGSNNSSLCGNPQN